MTQTVRKRRICSYDMAEVPSASYQVVEEHGEMYFCNDRCLCLWAMQFVTNPNRPEEQKSPPVELIAPSGERRRFAHFMALAQWSAASALKGEENPWHGNGIKL